MCPCLLAVNLALQDYSAEENDEAVRLAPSLSDSEFDDDVIPGSPLI